MDGRHAVSQTKKVLQAGRGSLRFRAPTHLVLLPLNLALLARVIPLSHSSLAIRRTQRP
eukprot:COSAG04_NODE_32428_length_251_cov_0.677632_1_plen_58_part_10